jgi:hypothetical protein
MPTTESVWKLIATPLPRGEGQKFFQHTVTGDLYVADWSGEDPEMTDCGPLRMLPNRPLIGYFDADLQFRIRTTVVVEGDGSNRGMGVVNLHPIEAHYLRENHGFQYELRVKPTKQQQLALDFIAVAKYVEDPDD